MRKKFKIITVTLLMLALVLSPSAVFAVPETASGSNASESASAADGSDAAEGALTESSGQEEAGVNAEAQANDNQAVSEPSSEEISDEDVEAQTDAAAESGSDSANESEPASDTYTEEQTEDVIPEDTGNPGGVKLKAPASSLNASSDLSFDFSGTEYKATHVVTPDETGYYELTPSFTSEESSDYVRTWVYEGDAWIGFFDIYNRNQNVSGTFYMEQGKEYTFDIHGGTGRPEGGPVGSFALNKLSQEDVDAMFTVEGGILKDYTGNMVNIRIPDGVTEVYCTYKFESPFDDGCCSIYYPASVTGIYASSINGKNRLDASPICGLYVDKNNASYKSIDGIVYTKDGTELVAAPRHIQSDELTIPEGVKSIGEYAFDDGGTDKIIMPDSLETIGPYAFCWSEWLHNIDLGKGVKKIDEYAFFSSGLSTLELPQSLELIKKSAFASCEWLTSVTFNGPTVCQDSVFSNDFRLNTININSDPVFDEGTLSFDCAIENVNIGSGSADWEYINGALIHHFDITKYPLFKLADDEYYDSWEDEEYPEDEEYTEETTGDEEESQDDSIYYDEYDYNLMKDETRLVLVTADYTGDSFTIGDDVDVVYYNAFQSENCNIQNITIGKKCRRLELAQDLKTIKVVSGNSTYFTTGSGALYSYYDGYGEVDKSHFYLVKFPMLSATTSFAVPATVKEIRERAFAYYGTNPRNLKKVTIPKSVDYVGYNVFMVPYEYDKSNKLTLVGFKGSSAEEYYNNNYESDALSWQTASSTYTVTFNANGGKSSKASKVCTMNGAIGTLPTATKTGASFMGWYTAKSGGGKVTTSTKVTKNMTLYAHWSRTIKFNGNGGKASKTAVKIEEGKTLGTLPTAKRSNYFFLGWYTAKSGGSKVTSKTKVTANKTYYARWAKAEIGNTKVSVKSCTWNGKAQKPAVTVTLNGVALKNGTDYTATYSNNKEVGKGKVKIKGKGVFAKSKKTKTATFNINKAAQVITAKNMTFAGSEKGKFKKLNIKVKESAKITLASSNKNVATVAATKAEKKKGDIKIVGMGTTTITIKTAATKHYKAGTKKITVKFEGQNISLGAAWLKYDKAKNVYLLSSDVFSKSLAVKRNGGAKYTVSIDQAGGKNTAWIESGDLMTAKGSGDFKVKVTTAKIGYYPAMTKVFTIRMTGKSMLNGDYLYRQLSGNNVAITKYIGTSTKPVVPATLKVSSKKETKIITEVADAAFSGTKAKLDTVKFNYTTNTYLKTIGKNAFKGCTTLTEVRLPAGLTSLGDNAFYGCTSLKTIPLPESLKVIPKGAFENCKSISGTYALPKTLKTINDRAFYGCSGIRRLMIYRYITEINKDAFNGCSDLRSVYFSAPASRWETVKKAVKSGNDPLLNAEMHYNAAEPLEIYPESNISDSELFRDYPEFLQNDSYEAATSLIENDIFTYLSTRTKEDITMAALKSEMQNGSIYCLTAIFEDVMAGKDGTSWSQTQLEEALAMDLLRTVAASDDTETVKSKYFKTFKEIHSIVGDIITDTDKKAIFKTDANRWHFAQKLDGKFKGRNASEINNMLKKIQEHWDQDEDNSKSWTIKGVYEGVGKTIEPAEYVFEVLMMNELYSDYIDRIMPYIPENTSLYRGFEQIKYKMDQPLDNYIVEYLNEKTTKELSKLVIDGTNSSFGFSGGAVSVATTFYKVLSLAIISPTIDDYNNAWLSLSNSMQLQLMLDDVSQKIIDNKGSDISSLADDHKMVGVMRFEAIKSAEKYVMSAMNKDGDEVYMQQRFDKYKDSMDYNTYIRSCKENLVESQQTTN